MYKLFLLSALALPVVAQTICQPTPTYSPCEIVFELTEQEAAGNPYLDVEIVGEFRSPRYRTFRMPGFWDGGRRFVIRFSPVDPGEWVFRISSNLPRFEGKQGTFQATPSESPGFLRAANVHHWALVDDNNRTPHLWMGDTLYTLPFIDRQVFDKLVAARAEQKFTHMRGVVLAPPDKPPGTFISADEPDPAAFRELDDRIRALNRNGIIADLMVAYDQRQLETLFPSWRQRERYISFLVARYAAMNVTWQGFENFERAPGGRAALREIGLLFKKLDPYQHPRSTGTAGTSSALLPDQWMDYVMQSSAADDVGAIEHQLYAVPFVDAGFAHEDSGAGKSRPGDVDTDTFRKRLWNSTMNGQYPTFANTGTRGGESEVDPKHIDSPGARQMAAWFDFFSRTRHWELEPYFDVDGGRAVALEGVEYVVYVEKPGPVEIVIERHGYDVAWFNPITGEFLKQKNFKGDRFSGEPPDNTHDWVLHISRESRKASMLRSYKFDSRETPIGMQEIEVNPQKAPFEIAEPAGDAVALSTPARFAVRLTRETRATSSMMYLWMAEVAADGEGTRIIGAGRKGTFQIPDNLAKSFPATLAVRLYGMNANGKVYSLIRVYKLTK